MLEPKLNKLPLTVSVLGFLLLNAALASPLNAASFSFKGNFTKDDDIQVIKFRLDRLADVTLKSLSYAGGTQADGTVIPGGGFDPSLSVFNPSGNLISINQDGAANQVPVDVTSGARGAFDSFLQLTLRPGTYTVALSQDDNFPIGLTLPEGFRYDGQPNFTSKDGCPNGIFCDAYTYSRKNYWAVDIANVDAASIPQAEVPEPATVIGAVLAMGIIGRRSLSKFKKGK